MQMQMVPIEQYSTGYNTWCYSKVKSGGVSRIAESDSNTLPLCVCACVHAPRIYFLFMQSEEKSQRLKGIASELFKTMQLQHQSTSNPVLCCHHRLYEDLRCTLHSSLFNLQLHNSAMCHQSSSLGTSSSALSTSAW